MTIEEMRSLDAEKTYKELLWEPSEILRLTAANIQLREGCEDLKHRIQRLEEAGDRLAYWFDPREQKHFDALEAWRKAKEAKP